MIHFIKREFVVMDGTDYKKLNEIVGITKMLSGWYNARFVAIRNLDAEHPSIKVVRTSLSRKDFKWLEKVLEREYPGLCVFNAVL